MDYSVLKNDFWVIIKDIFFEEMIKKILKIYQRVIIIWED